MSGRGGKQKQKKKQPKTASAKAREKMVIDKTFGMKNKKGKKAQQARNQIQNQVSKQQAARERANRERREAKKAEQARAAEERRLMGRIVQKAQHCPPGVDPKTILCMYFKRGHCENGSRCKFSHDKRIEQKMKAKKNIYEEDTPETMEDWDEKTLRKAVDAVSKKSKANATAKICNHFLKAIEDRKFGWNWVCPRGNTCIYRHVLPKGYVLKPKKAEVVEERPLHEILEEERAKLTGNGTPVTPESFQKWKDKIKADLEAKKAAETTKRQKAVARGAKLTGRELLENASSDQFAHEGTADDDLLALRRQRRLEEEEADKENAKIAEEMNAAMAEVEKNMDDPNRPKKPKQEEQKKEEEKTEGQKEEPAGEKVKVDASLFQEDEDLDDLEFSEDE